MKNQKHWTKEIEGYISGMHTEDERYDLEKAALDDEFLFDALEGYSLHAHAKSDSSAQPQASPGSARVFSLRNIAVAASLIALIAVVGYMVSPNAQKDNQLADATSTEVSETTPIAMATEAESSQEDAVASYSVEPTEEQFQKAADLAKKETARSTAVNPVVKEEPKKNTKVSRKREAPKADAAKPQVDLKENQATQTVAMEKANAFVETSDKIDVDKQGLGLAPAKSLGLKTEMNPYAYVAEPEMGWKGLETYIGQNKKSMETIKPVVVDLTWTLLADGTIEDLKANQIGCDACAAEAIRLLKGSGTWKNLSGKPQEIRYQVKF